MSLSDAAGSRGSSILKNNFLGLGFEQPEASLCVKEREAALLCLGFDGVLPVAE